MADCRVESKLAQLSPGNTLILICYPDRLRRLFIFSQRGQELWEMRGIIRRASCLHYVQMRLGEIGQIQHGRTQHFIFMILLKWSGVIFRANLIRLLLSTWCFSLTKDKGKKKNRSGIMCLKVTDVQGFPYRTSTVWESRESNMMGCERVCVRAAACAGCRASNQPWLTSIC